MNYDYENFEEYFANLSDDEEYLYGEDYRYKLHSIPDLSYFRNLRQIYCSFNCLTQLPPLPPALEVLECKNNQITVLPPLPSTLSILMCECNELTNLPELPISLTYLSCSHNKITLLPELPPYLEYLNCAYNQVIKLPRLPLELKRIVCCNNELTELPFLPPMLHQLICCFNKITCLPEISMVINILYISKNQLPYWLQIEGDRTAENNVNMTNAVNRTYRFKELYYILKFKRQFRAWLWEKVREPKIRQKYHPDNLLKMLEGREEMTLDELDELHENW